MNPNELAGFLVSVLRGSKDERHFYVFETPDGPHRVIVEQFKKDTEDAEKEYQKAFPVRKAEEETKKGLGND